MALDLRGRLGDSAPAVIALTGTAGGRPAVVVATNAGARERGIKAGALVRVAAQALGGGGGGKDDLAQGGGTDASRTGDALGQIDQAVQAAAG
jgi:alanyl-tRNA synthetase